MKNIFDKAVTDELIARIEKLTPESQPLWGKMSVSQMLAHCSVTYEFIFEDKHPKPGALKRWMLKTFVKKIVTGDKPYKKNSPTAPEFKVSDQKEFELEKQRLIAFMKKTQEMGEKEFENRESRSFGILSLQEWNSMFYKHLDHHLTQFGV